MQGIPTVHPDFGPNAWVNTAEANGVDGTDDDNNGVVDDINGAAFVNGVESGNVQDANGHG
jgi:hypothetical protein